MKNKIIGLLVLCFLFSLSSCALFNRKANCPAYDSVHTETRKDGSFKKSKTKSNLFPKKMRKQR